MLAPLLSAADLESAAEGSIDPLGLMAIAESLAGRLVPGVRERQQHPRFLTAIAVSLAVCETFDEDTVASDRRSEPWQVFEWYAVEGMVRATRESDDIKGLPGRDKAQQAIHDDVPLSAARYLKAPSTTGFHGVYRSLSEALHVDMNGRLDEFGHVLSDTWATEQKLKGFIGAAEGPGVARRNRLREAVEDGLKRGAVARSPGWSGWQFFADHLTPYKAGRKEARLITKSLLDPSEPFRRKVLEFLISNEGQETLAPAVVSERRFHEALAKRSDPALSALLKAIMTYERFSRLLSDAFDDCLLAMSRGSGPTQLSAFAGAPSVKKAVAQIPDLYEDLVDRLSVADESDRFRAAFGAVAESASPADWTERLLEHHRKIQRAKPPDGKAPWFERFDNGACVIRPAYRLDERPDRDDVYVHKYRTGSLWSFAQDLRMF